MTERMEGTTSPQESIKKTIEFESHHGRKGTIEVLTGGCHVCKKENIKVIAIDSSADEYGPGCICKDCAMKAFEE